MVGLGHDCIGSRSPGQSNHFDCSDLPQCALHSFKPAVEKGGCGRLIGQTKGGIDIKLHAVTDTSGRPIRLKCYKGKPLWPSCRRRCIDCERKELGVSGRGACPMQGYHWSTRRKVRLGRSDEEQLTEDVVELAHPMGARHSSQIYPKTCLALERANL